MKLIIRGWIALFMALVALGGSTTASSYTIDTASSPSALTGLWWNANESGWGLTVTQQYSIIFVAMYTYDTANNPIWYVITNCPVVAGGCTGDIYKVKGGSTLTTSWAPNLALTKVGSGTLAFSDANSATMNFTIDGVAGSKAITRQVFASPPTQTGTTFPFTYKGLQLNSLTFATHSSGVYCQATLSLTNLSGTSINALLSFDTIIGGARVGQFGFQIVGFAPGATVILSGAVSTSTSGTQFPACGTFTYLFNAAATTVVTVP